MKKTGWLGLCLCALLCLAGCGRSAPEQAADGGAWDEAWVNVGNVIGVETPEDLTPRENSDVLDAKGMYYATWSAGEAESIVNEDGEDAQVYGAQLYLLIAGSGSVEKAEETREEWLSLARERYAVEKTSAEVYNGQAFTVVAYTCPSETNPYARGASAFGVYGNFAVSAELCCREDFDGDAPALLAEFLERCHYAA